MTCHLDKKKQNVSRGNFRDTTFLKSIVWDSLNPYVAYHIIDKGNITHDTNYHFNFTYLASFYYFNHGYGFGKKDTIVVKPNDLKTIILSDDFTKFLGLDCIFKANSELYYLKRPDLLQNITIWPMDWEPNNLKKLMQSLKNDPHVDSVSLKPFEKTEFNSKIYKDKLQRYLVVARLKPEYRDIRKLPGICLELQHNYSLDTAFYNDMFSGNNKMDYYFWISSVKNN